MKPECQVLVAFQCRHVGLAQLRLDTVQGGLVQHGQRGHNDGQGFQEQPTFSVNATYNLKDIVILQTVWTKLFDFDFENLPY